MNDVPTGLRLKVLQVMAAPLFAAVERSWPFRMVVWRLTPRLYRITGGRAAVLFPCATAVIDTRDLRNGRRHRRAVIRFADEHGVFVIPSRGGGPRDPHWYENALAEPDVLFDGRPCRAEPVHDAEEAARLFALAERHYPGVAEYRRHAAKHGRVIPILRLCVV